MKATARVLAAGVATMALGLAGEAAAQQKHGGHGARGHGGHGHHGHRGHGHRHGHWHGHGHRHWYGGWGLSIGVPLFGWGVYGYPGYWDYPAGGVVYREVERLEPVEVATTEIPRGESTPTQGPLYMNYCESAKAYFPKVSTCPEGWKLATPTR